MDSPQIRARAPLASALLSILFCTPLAAQATQLQAKAVVQSGAAQEQTLQLFLDGDAQDLRVVDATLRLFTFQSLRGFDHSGVTVGSTSVRGRVRIQTMKGQLLHEGPVDFRDFNMDLGRLRGKDLVDGDVIRSGRLRFPLKIPNRGTDRSRLLIQYRDAKVWRTLCTTTMGAARRLAAKTQSPLLAPTVKTHLNNGPVANRYDIVVLGDGYQASEVTRFYQDIATWMGDLFAREPYKSYKGYFNVHSVFRASAQSGADHPDRKPPIYKNTAYDASYNTGGTARCLYIKNGTRALADAKLAPDVEGRIVVFVNDSRYGGCAGTFAVSYNGSSGRLVQSHEFGHSFGGLADEYDYGRSGTYGGIEPRQANVTKDKTGKSKWGPWLGFQGVAAYEGAMYYKKGLFRPKSNCLMRALSAPLCPVCVEQLTKQAYATVDPIEKLSPAAKPITLRQPASQSFSFQNLVPGGGKVTWTVNGLVKQSGGSSFVFASSSYAPSIYIVRLTVHDTTAFVRQDPSKRLFAERSWTITVLGSSSSSLGTVPKGMEKLEGSASHHPAWVNSPGRVQYLYRNSVLPHSSNTRTLKGLRVRQNGTSATIAYSASMEISISSQGVAVESPSTKSFSSNHGKDLRVAFRKKTVNWSKIGKPASAPAPFFQSFKFDQAQTLTGPEFCVDVKTYGTSATTHEWRVDAHRALDSGTLRYFGSPCPSGFFLYSRGNYVGGDWSIDTYSAVTPSKTSFVLHWLGTSAVSVKLPGTKPTCTLYTMPALFHPKPVLTNTLWGYAKFDWGRVPSSLRGKTVFAQILAVDPNYNAVGLRLTQGLEIRFGAGWPFHAVSGYATSTRSFDPDLDKPQTHEAGLAAVFELY